MSKQLSYYRQMLIAVATGALFATVSTFIVVLYLRNVLLGVCG